MDAGGWAAVSGLIGAIIGSASSIATIIVQSRTKDRRDRSKQVTELSLAEFNHHFELAKLRPGGAEMMPISAYVHNNNLLLNALDEGELNPKRIVEIFDLNSAFIKAVRTADEKQRENVF